MKNFRKAIYRTKKAFIPTYYTHNFSLGKITEGIACIETVYPVTLYTSTDTITIGTVFYTNSGLTTAYNGVNLWFKKQSDLSAYNINTIGELIEISIVCATLLPLTQYCYRGQFAPDDVIHVPPGGEVYYEDEYGNPQTETMIITTSGIVSVYSSSLPTKNSGAFLVNCTTGDPI